jgi:WD40 repeat protein
VDTGESLLTLRGHTNYVETVRFTPDGQYLVSASLDKTVKLWNIAGHTAGVNSVAYGSDGKMKMLATGSGDRTAAVWDVTGTFPRLIHPPLRGHQDQVYRVAFSHDGKRLATAGFDKRLILWDIQSGDKLAVLEKHADQLRDVAYSPDGDYLASVDADGFAFLFTLETNGLPGASTKVVHYLDGKAQASAVAFRPGTNQWATAGYDGTVSLWDYTGNRLGTLVAGNKLYRLAFSPDGKSISALGRKWIFTWPVSAFQSSQVEPADVLKIEGTGYCPSLAYSPDLDGSQIAVGCKDGKVRLYSTTNRTLEKTMRLHSDVVQDLAFSPDGSELATASLDRSFLVSPLRFNDLYDKAKKVQAAISGKAKQASQ